MGSIEGVIVLSPTNEPILHSHFLHPLPNYPILHADQLVEKLEAASSVDAILPISYTDKIPCIPHEEEESDDRNESEDGQKSLEELRSRFASPQKGSALVHIQHKKLRFIATFSKHLDPLFPLSFLHTLLSILKLYLGDPLTEDSIRENIDVVYQLLEEMLDETGQPANTEYNALRDIVREPSWMQNLMGKMASVPGLSSSAPPPHVSDIPWRRPLQATQRTSRNEIYVDVVETLQGSFSRGLHPRALPNLCLTGAIECNSKLNGTPDLSLCFNDTKVMGAISLHPCVRVKRWKREGVFSFIPPDGSFVLADFDLKVDNSLEKQVPIWIHCRREEKIGLQSTTFQIEVGANTSVDELEISFDVQEKGCTFDSIVTGGSQGSGLAIEDINALKGTVQHDAKSGVIRWSISRLSNSQKPLVLSGSFKGDSAPKLSSAIRCRFVVPLKSAADLKVTSLEIVNESGTRPSKGVRNLLKGDLDWRW
ncbi:hypothetical protein CBS101457_001042 [Exobasidium rhododendri]|nr:hypothetical protein CBS101457_001042 [Exobasidium rhododendri]